MREKLKKNVALATLIMVVSGLVGYAVFTNLSPEEEKNDDDDDDEEKEDDEEYRIFLLGTNPQYVGVNSTYVEASAMVVAEDGSVGFAEINSTNVNVSCVGTYIVYYTAGSNVENRSVIVYDPEFESIATEFARVLLGEAIVESSLYVINNNSIHPIVLLNKEGQEHEFCNMVPLEWRPDAIEENELVLLIEEEQANVFDRVCFYTNGTPITRVQYSRNVTLYSSKTGEVLNFSTLLGSEPRECQEIEDANLVLIEGSHVEWISIEHWLYDNKIDLSLS